METNNLQPLQNYPNYQNISNSSRLNCNQQSIPTVPQKSHYLPYSMPPISSNIGMPPQPLMYNTQNAYNIMYSSQTMYPNQNSFPPPPPNFNSYCSQYNTDPWLTENTQNQTNKLKGIKNVSEKITNDKLSPHSCCSSQMDAIAIGICSPLSDSFKTVLNSELTNYRNSQWHYNSNFNTQNLPSCSQISNDMDSSATLQNNCCQDYSDVKNTINSVKYCSIQKSYDSELMKSYPNNKYSSEYLNDPILFNLPQIQEKPPDKPAPGKDFSEYRQCELMPLTTCQQDSSENVTQTTQFFATEMPCLDIYGDVKNDSKSDSQCGGESDIIVEESEDDSSVSSEECDIENTIIYICVVCSITSSTPDVVFFRVNDETLLTSTTQIPVVQKLRDITTKIFPKSIMDHICNLCLRLVNNVDCLEFQLNNSKKQLIEICEKASAVLQEVANETLETTHNSQEETLINDKTKIDNTNFDLNLSEDFIQPTNDLNSSQNKRICKICNKYFCQSDFHKHKQLHANHMNFKCSLCHRSFTMKRLLDNHMKRHNGERDFLCDRCGKNYIKRHTLELHLRRHYNQFTFFCETCKKGFVTNSSLEIHRRCHTDVRPYDCKICAKKFRTNTNLQEHVRYCSGDLPFECDQCDKKFAAVAKLNDHIKLRHEKNFKITCEHCGMGFTKMSDHKIHLVSHSDVKSFSCSKCQKKYKTIGNLNHHMKVHGELPFKCDICQKGFRRKENYEIHKNLHSGVKPFPCTVCSKKFAAQIHLDAHLKIHNGTVKKKTCTVCGKQLTHGLTEHMRLHTGDRPFKCLHCSLTFASKCALQKHNKRKHSM